MGISIYSSAFNLIQNNFDYEDAIRNFSLFADEVVLAINTSVDNTYEVLESLQETYGNLELIECRESYDDPLLDGKIKNIALQATKGEVKIGLDMDERIPIRHKSRWLNLGNQLSYMPFDAFMVPSLNLWGSYSTIKNDLLEHLRSSKWYIHGSGLYRGAVNFARRADGTVDTRRSDTCELIYENGDLVKYEQINAFGAKSVEEFLNLIENQLVFVFHLGYADFQNRVDRNRNFWYKHWRTESGGEPPRHQVHMDVNEFRGSVVPHNLTHWNEGAD